MPVLDQGYHCLSDTELFRLVKSEERGAFEALYQRHWPDLVAAAYRKLQSFQKAEDIVQDLFVHFYQRRQMVEFTVSMRAYLHQALKYRIINEFRAENVRNAYRQRTFFYAVCRNDFVDELESKDLGRRIEKIADSLPEKCREVFLLSRMQCLSNKDISADLHISVSTVEKHIGKALKTFRQNLHEYAIPY